MGSVLPVVAASEVRLHTTPGDTLAATLMSAAAACICITDTDNHMVDSHTLNTASAPAPLPTYREYVEASTVLDRLDEIGSFQYQVRYQPTSALTDPAHADSILGVCVDATVDVLKKSGIQNLQHLKAKIQSRDEPSARLSDERALFTITQSEGRFHFQIDVFDDRIRISRSGSAFSDFYAWYRLFMPESSTIEAALRRHIESVSRRTLEIIETTYSFAFTFADFQSRGVKAGGRATPSRSRNVEVLSKVVSNIPETGGTRSLTELDFYRVDLTLSRLETFTTDSGERARNCWYILEAPFNETGRFLVFNAQLRNSSLESLALEGDDSGSPVMMPFDDDFADDYRLALVDFLRDRALETFMAGLLQLWDFSTERGVS